MVTPSPQKPLSFVKRFPIEAREKFVGSFLCICVVHILNIEASSIVGPLYSVVNSPLESTREWTVACMTLWYRGEKLNGKLTDKNL